MAGFNDTTLGYQRIGFLGGGIKMEVCYIGASNDISASNTTPTTLSKLLGWQGYACYSLGCVSGHMASGITNMSLCEGPVLEISVGDTTTGVDTANSKMNYTVWGW